MDKPNINKGIPSNKATDGTTIKIKISTREHLKKYGKFSETYNDIIVRILAAFDKQ